MPPPGEAECRDRQISENDPKKGYLCAPALLSAQCLLMLLHEERASPCLVPSNRTLHYRNTGMVTDPCSAPSRTSVPRLMSHTPVCSNVWSRATRHSLKEWMVSVAMDAVLSRPTEQALKKRVGGNVTDPKLAAQARRSSNVLARATSHSLEEWVGWEAAGAVLSRPAQQALERRVGGDAAGAVLSHPTLPGSMKYGQNRGTATLRPQSS